MSQATAWVVGGGLLIIAVVLFALTDMCVLLQHEKGVVTNTKATIVVNFMHITSLFVWPLVWYQMMSTRSDWMGADLIHLLSLLWPMLLLLLDMTHIGEVRKHGYQFESLYRYNYMHTSAATLIGAAFAIGSVMGNKLRGAARMPIVASVLICVLTLIPTTSVPITSRMAIVTRHFQKICLTYAIGLVSSGMLFAVA